MVLVFFFFFPHDMQIQRQNGAVGSVPPDAGEFPAAQNHPAQTWELPLMGDASYQDGQQ